MVISAWQYGWSMRGWPWRVQFAMRECRKLGGWSSWFPPKSVSAPDFHQDVNKKRLERKAWLVLVKTSSPTTPNRPQTDPLSKT